MNDNTEPAYHSNLPIIKLVFTHRKCSRYRDSSAFWYFCRDKSAKLPWPLPARSDCPIRRIRWLLKAIRDLWAFLPATKRVHVKSRCSQDGSSRLATLRWGFLQRCYLLDRRDDLRTMPPPRYPDREFRSFGSFDSPADTTEALYHLHLYMDTHHLYQTSHRDSPKSSLV